MSPILKYLIFGFIGFFLLACISAYLEVTLKKPIRRYPQLPILFGVIVFFISTIFIHWFFAAIMGIIVYFFFNDTKSGAKKCKHCGCYDTDFYMNDYSRTDGLYNIIYKCNKCKRTFVAEIELKEPSSYTVEKVDHIKAKHENRRHRCWQCKYYREYLSRCQRDTDERPVINGDELACGYFEED